MRAWPAVLVVLLGLLPSLAEAKQVALVVGVARYEQIESLKNPVRDAGAIADRLRDRGFDVIEALDADRYAIDRARRRFLDEAKGADLALFYFAGHGVQLFDRNVLLVRDAAPQSATAIDALGLDLTALIAEVRAQSPVRAAFLIDACRNNPLSFDDTVALLRRLEPTVGGGGTGERGTTRAPARGLSGIALPPRKLDGAETLAFFAAQPGAASFDGEGRNSYFVEGLLEGFAKSGRPLSEILRGAGAFVRTVTNGQQVPQLVSDWTTDIVLGQSDQVKVRYLNAYRAGTSLEPMPDAEARIVGEAQRAYPALTGTFIVKESQSFTDNYLAANEAERAKAKALGSVNGFAIDYDIDRDGRLETLGVFFRQTNVVLQVIDEGVSLLDTPCWDFDKNQVEAVEIGLRDINGDRKPEVFLHYQTEPGNWGTFCILEYIGNPDLAQARRGSQSSEFAPKPLFRTLLRYDGAWTVRVGADNSIETCAGSNCHTRSSFAFDGTAFHMTLDESQAPSAAKAKPFRDEAERQANLAGKAQPQPRGKPAAPSGPGRATATLGSVEHYVATVYLPSGNSGKTIPLAYEPDAIYYGQPASRAAIDADKRRYAAKWPRRAYHLDAATLKVSPSTAIAGAQDVSFEYTFEVGDGKRILLGRGRTALTLRPHGASFSIAREEGQVLKGN